MEYHPYDSRFSGKRNINISNIDRIESAMQGKKELRFAVISDTQRWYDATHAMVNHINATEGIDFVIHCGDLTDFSLTEEFVWMRDELETLGTTAMELIENPVSQELAAAITATVNAIADVATYEAAAALLETLKSQVADVKLCIAAYEDYLAVVAAAEKELERGFTEGVDEFTAAIAAAKAAHENGTLSLEEVEAAIVKLNDDIFTFQMLNADGSERFDVTGRFMTNPTLRKGNQGWSGSAPGLEHEVMEFYNCDFDMYQELTGLPNGMYVVQVQALYRVGGNDSGVAYEEGTENISAQLYANNKSVPLISIYQHRASDMGVTSDQVLNDYVNMRVAVNEAFTFCHLSVALISSLFPPNSATMSTLCELSTL
jgi:hypothetical protein